MYNHSTSRLLVREEITYHTACQAASHEGKPYKEEETCRRQTAQESLEALFSTDAIPVDRVYEVTFADWVPGLCSLLGILVHGYWTIWLIIWWMRVRRDDSGIKECPESKSELGKKGSTNDGSVGKEGTEWGRGE